LRSWPRLAGLNADYLATQLAAYLRAHGITDIDVAGLAADFCVYFSMADALAELVRTSDTHSGLTHAGRPLPLIDDAPACLVIRSLAHSTEAIARLHEQATDIVKDA